MPLLAIPLVYALYVGTMTARQAHLLFPAAANAPHALADVPSSAEVVEVATRFGRARAVYWPPRDPSRRAPAVWYAHGNFETVENAYATIQPLRERGYAVMQFEYPGYGGTDGEPGFDSIAAMADATWDWLSARPDVDPARIVAVGYSIGGGPAADLTRRHDVAALALVSTFPSLRAIANRFLLPSAAVRFPYDTEQRVRAFDGPVFVFHGVRDAVIPFRFGRRLASAAGAATFVTQDCGHDDCDFAHGLFAHALPDWIDDAIGR